MKAVIFLDSPVFKQLGQMFLALHRQSIENEFFEIDFRAGIVDINAHQVAIFIVIQNHAFRNVDAVHTGFGRQIDIKRIGFRILVQFHGLNLRSGNALYDFIF